MKYGDLNSDDPYNIRYGRMEYIGKFGVKAFWWHVKGIYEFRRAVKDSRWKAWYIAIKYAGTL